MADRADRSARGRSAAAVSLIDPIVIEADADVALAGTSLRHAVRDVRTRPELAPDDLQALLRAV